MLTLDSRTRSRLVWAATLLAPVFAVQGVRLALDAAPAVASAAPTPAAAPAAAAPTAARPLSPAQRAALEWTKARREGSLLRSPMDRPDDAPPPPVVQVAAPAAPEAAAKADKPETPPADAALHGLSLTALIAGGPDALPMAVINRRFYREGEPVGPGWTLAAIDARRGSITLAGPEGRRMELATPRPIIQRPDR